MRITIFSEAIKNQAYLEEYGTWHNKVKFRYVFPNEEEIFVDVTVEDNRTIYSCSCQHHSLHELALCQYTLGVMFYFFKLQMKKVKAKW